jgi:RNA polymerase subunit RPABC4/transcription elongation factor Spt4
MTLIKCPQCSQTVLSVASVCPKCGFLLLQAPPPHGEERAFVTCRRCDKVIPRGAQTCQYCGYPQRFRRRLRIVGAVVLALAALAVGFIGFGLWRPSVDQSANEERPVTPPAVTPQPAPVEAEVSVTPPPATAQAVPDTTRPTPATPTTSPTPPASTRSGIRATLSQWTVTWANVRDAPALEGAIVGILRPGSQINGVRVPGGWWAVYSGDSLVGYVASSLLADHLLPPESLGIGPE